MFHNFRKCRLVRSSSHLSRRPLLGSPRKLLALFRFHWALPHSSLWVHPPAEKGLQLPSRKSPVAALGRFDWPPLLLTSPRASTWLANSRPKDSLQQTQPPPLQSSHPLGFCFVPRWLFDGGVMAMCQRHVQCRTVTYGQQSPRACPRSLNIFCDKNYCSVKFCSGSGTNLTRDPRVSTIPTASLSFHHLDKLSS